MRFFHFSNSNGGRSNNNVEKYYTFSLYLLPNESGTFEILQKMFSLDCIQVI